MAASSPIRNSSGAAMRSRFWGRRLDISGWDLRKALRLLRKSNPALLEWLQSPIVYREDAQALDALRSLAARCYSPRTCLQHYLHMARATIASICVEKKSG